MTSPENNSSLSVFKRKKEDASMALDLNIFEIENGAHQERVCVSDVQEEVHALVWHLGGPAKASKAINVEYNRLKEWHLGRAPIPLLFLRKLLDNAEEPFASRIQNKINSKNIFLRLRSKHWVTFPRKITPELSYVIGLLLGDGYLAGDSLNKKGNWGVGAYFDNREHAAEYSRLMNRIFGCEVKIYKPPKNYFTAYFASRAVHWFLRSFFDLKNGHKDSRIEIPERIINTGDKGIINACVRGLFDSDGTVKKNCVSYSSTSEKIIDQIQPILQSQGMVLGKHNWLKAEKYKMLYTLRVNRKSLSRFSRAIGFSHPGKKKRLNTLLN